MDSPVDFTTNTSYQLCDIHNKGVNSGLKHKKKNTFKIAYFPDLRKKVIFFLGARFF